MAVTLKALPRDRAGRLVLPGNIETREEIDYTRLSAVPASVTASGGTVIGSPAGGTGRLKLETAATANAVASITRSNGVTPADARAIVYTVDAEWPAGMMPSGVFLALQNGTTEGIVWRKASEELRARTGSDGPLRSPVGLGRAGRTTRVSLSLVLLPADKHIALLSGDQVINAGIIDATVLAGVLSPHFAIQTNVAEARSVNIIRDTLTIRR